MTHRMRRRLHGERPRYHGYVTLVYIKGKDINNVNVHCHLKYNLDSHGTLLCIFTHSDVICSLYAHDFTNKIPGIMMCITNNT